MLGVPSCISNSIILGMDKSIVKAHNFSCENGRFWIIWRGNLGDKRPSFS